MLPVIWTAFALAAVGGFLMVAAYWLDLNERHDLSRRARLAWLAGILAFPVTIPAYAFTPGSRWPPLLRVAAFIPLLAIALFLGFALSIFA